MKSGQAGDLGISATIKFVKADLARSERLPESLAHNAAWTAGRAGLG